MGARFGVGRDPRQLYALDRRNGRLVYLPDGVADVFRADCDAGYLICPLPSCADPRYLAVGGSERRHHFRHRAAGLPPHDTWDWYRHTARELLAQQLRDRHPERRIETDVALVGETRADLVIRSRGDDLEPVVVHVQYARIPTDGWLELHDAYASRGIADVWLFGHLQPHFRRPRHAPENDEIAQLGTLLQTVADTGLEVVFIDPDRRELAVALIASGGQRLPAVELALEAVDELRIEDGTLVTPALQAERNSRAEREQRERRMLERQQLTARPWGGGSRRLLGETPAQPRFRGGVPPLLHELPPRAPARSAGADALAAWEEAKGRFLNELGLAELPEVVDHCQESDFGIDSVAPAHWHARLVYRYLQGRIGEAFTLYDALSLVAGDADDLSLGSPARDAVSLYLFYLRRSGYVHFETVGREIADPVTVLADLTHPPGELLQNLALGGPFRVRLHKHNGKLVVVSEQGELVVVLRPLRPDELVPT